MRYSREISSGEELQSLFAKHGRENKFTYEGFDAVFDDLEALGYDEVDVVEICSMYSEFEPADYIEYNGMDHDELLEWMEEMEFDPDSRAPEFDTSTLIGIIDREGAMPELLEELTSRDDDVVCITDADTILTRS